MSINNIKMDLLYLDNILITSFVIIIAKNGQIITNDVDMTIEV